MNEHTSSENEGERQDSAQSGSAQEGDTIQATIHRLASRIIRLKQQCSAAGLRTEADHLQQAILHLAKAVHTLDERSQR